MKKSNVPPKEPMLSMPEKITEIFEQKGILSSAIRLFYKSDMGESLEYCDTWVVITDTELSVLEVLPGIFPRKTHNFFDNRKTIVDIVERSFRSYSLDEYTDFHVEELVSGGRAVATNKETGLDEVIFNFSNSAKDGAYVICRGTGDKSVKQEDFGKGKDMSDGDAPPPRGPGGPGGRRPPGKKMSRSETKRIISKMLPFFMKYKLHSLVVLVMVVFSSLLALLSPYMSGSFFIDRVLSNTDPQNRFYGQIAVAILIIASTKLLSTVFTMVHSIVTAKISANVTYDLKKTIFESIQKHSLSFFLSRQTGGLMTQINQDSRSLYWFFVDGLPYFVTNIVQFVAILILLFSALIAQWA